MRRFLSSTKHERLCASICDDLAITVQLYQVLRMLSIIGAKYLSHQPLMLILANVRVRQVLPQMFTRIERIIFMCFLDVCLF